MTVMAVGGMPIMLRMCAGVDRFGLSVLCLGGVVFGWVVHFRLFGW